MKHDRGLSFSSCVGWSNWCAVAKCIRCFWQRIIPDATFANINMPSHLPTLIVVQIVPCLQPFQGKGVELWIIKDFAKQWVICDELWVSHLPACNWLGKTQLFIQATYDAALSNRLRTPSTTSTAAASLTSIVEVYELRVKNTSLREIVVKPWLAISDMAIEFVVTITVTIRVNSFVSRGISQIYRIIERVTEPVRPHAGLHHVEPVGLDNRRRSENDPGDHFPEEGPERGRRCGR